MAEGFSPGVSTEGRGPCDACGKEWAIVRRTPLGSGSATHPLYTGVRGGLIIRSRRSEPLTVVVK